MSTVIKFEIMPADGKDGLPVYIDEVMLVAGEACAAEIEEGPLAGLWMFRSKARAEEFCWKRGLEPRFVEAGDD